MHRPARTLSGALALGALVLSAAPASAAVSHSQISGSGSSWSSNAVAQWVADVEPSGLKVDFTPSGSAIGRKDYANKTTDFAVSDIGFQGKDKISGEDDTSLGRSYAYLPIVAGGTAFPYKLVVAGKPVRNLRLSGTTLVKIFTNQIKNWNDKAITADNNGRVFPSKTIIPVVHAEGSGSSAQLTKYFDDVYPSIWRPFFGKAGFTEYYPHDKPGAIAQDGSDQVMNYVASDAADGAIGYDEYSYALGKNFPVAKLENDNGFFTLPTQYNVAVALRDASINMDKSSPDYLLQNLSKVYRKKDDRAYPLSSYSYMIIPTASNDSRMVTSKRQTLADYLYYSICDGQKEVGPIGYSPLPINLAQASFDQIAKLKQADPNVDLTKRTIDTCGNPTFVAGQPNRNYLAEIAPKPPACDNVKAGPCVEGTARTGNPTKAGVPGGSTSGGSSTGGTTGGGSTGAASTGGAVTPSTTGGSTGGATSTSNGTTGAVTAAGTGAATDTSTSGEAVAVPTDLAAGHATLSATTLGPLAVLLLLAAIVLPPVLSRRFGRSP